MSVWADPPVPGARIEAGKDSGRRHLCLEEMSRGFLRPSLEETLVFSRSRSVGEEEEAGVVGTCWIRFFFLFCFSLVIPLSFPFVITRSLLSFVGTPVPPFTDDFPLLRLAPA